MKKIQSPIANVEYWMLDRSFDCNFEEERMSPPVRLLSQNLPLISPDYTPVDNAARLSG